MFCALLINPLATSLFVFINLELCGLVCDSWLCDYVVVAYEGVDYEFLVYDWINKKEVTVTEGRGNIAMTYLLKFIHSNQPEVMGEGREENDRGL